MVDQKLNEYDVIASAWVLQLNSSFIIIYYYHLLLLLWTRVIDFE